MSININDFINGFTSISASKPGVLNILSHSNICQYLSKDLTCNLDNGSYGKFLLLLHIFFRSIFILILLSLSLLLSSLLLLLLVLLRLLFQVILLELPNELDLLVLLLLGVDELLAGLLATECEEN